MTMEKSMLAEAEHVEAHAATPELAPATAHVWQARKAYGEPGTSPPGMGGRHG